MDKPGNAAKLRKSLELCAELAASGQYDNDCPYDVASTFKKVDAALAAPPRNCDVGSPTEQAERFKRFCKEHTDSGRNPSCGMCPILPVVNRGETKELCPFHWGQLPYDAAREGGG